MKQWLVDRSSSMARLMAVVFALLATFGFAGARAESSASQSQVYEVETGGQRAVKLAKPVQRVAVGDAQIAKIKMLNNQDLLIQGIKAGTTSLLIWDKGAPAPASHRIQVNEAVNPALLAAYPSLRLKSSSDLMLLGGTSADMVQHVAAREVAKRAGNQAKAPLADNARLAYGGEVQIDVRVVELSRKVLKEAGLSLYSTASAISFGTFAPGKFTSASAYRNMDSPVSKALTLLLGSPSGDVLGLLSLLEGNGFARTLAQPTLVAQSGQTASFLAGGEIPITIAQALGQNTTQFKPYGIRLDAAPTLLGENRIALKIASEVSEPIFDINDKLHSLTTRRAETSIELGNGESFVIGGLVSQNVTKNIDKIPGLGDIPGLGIFFKSVRLSREDKELLIIVTPKLVRPIAANVPIGPLPGAELADYNPSLWELLTTSDRGEAASFTGLSR